MCRNQLFLSRLLHSDRATLVFPARDLIFAVVRHDASQYDLQSCCRECAAFRIPTRPLNATVFSHAAADPRSNKLLCERRHRWSISGGLHVAALTRFQPLSHFGPQNHLYLTELLPN